MTPGEYERGCAARASAELRDVADSLERDPLPVVDGGEAAFLMCIDMDIPMDRRVEYFRDQLRAHYVFLVNALRFRADELDGLAAKEGASQ